MSQLASSVVSVLNLYTRSDRLNCRPLGAAATCIYVKSQNYFYIHALQPSTIEVILLDKLYKLLISFIGAPGTFFTKSKKK